MSLKRLVAVYANPLAFINCLQGMNADMLAETRVFPEIRVVTTFITLLEMSHSKLTPSTEPFLQVIRILTLTNELLTNCVGKGFFDLVNYTIMKT